MKKILALILSLLISFNSYAAWDGGKPAGTDLISDIDTLQQANNTAIENTLGGLTGWQNLSVSYTSAASVTVTADSLYLQDASGIAYRATSVSEVITITTSGASGLVSSLSEASGTWYYIYIARKSSDGTTNGFISTTSSLTTALAQFDSGYDQAALVSAVRNDGSSNFVSFKQYHLDYWYSSWQTIASGSASAWTSISTSAYVPSGLSNIIRGALHEDGDSETAAITNDNTITTTVALADRNKIYGGASGSGIRPFEFNLLTADTLYWGNNNSGANVYCSGFRINKL